MFENPSLIADVKKISALIRGPHHRCKKMYALIIDLENNLAYWEKNPNKVRPWLVRVIWFIL